MRRKKREKKCDHLLKASFKTCPNMVQFRMRENMPVSMAYFAAAMSSTATGFGFLLKSKTWCDPKNTCLYTVL